MADFSDAMEIILKKELEEEKSKQNITRDIEVKNNLTIARGEGGRDSGGEGFSGNTIKDTWTKARGGWKQGREVGLAGVGWREGEKMQTIVIQQ